METALMPTLKLHYDGWLLLPAGLRRALGLNSGDRLATELVDSALILRPVSKSRHPEAREEAEASVSVAPAQAWTAAEGCRRHYRARHRAEEAARTTAQGSCRPGYQHGSSSKDRIGTSQAAEEGRPRGQSHILGCRYTSGRAAGDAELAGEGISIR